MRAYATCVVMVTSLLACRGDRPANAEAREPANETAEKPAAGGQHALVLTPEQLRSAGIATAIAEERAQTFPIQATATIEPTADGVARIGPQIAGRLTALRAQVGDRIRAGQVLARLDAPELGRARADYLAALAAADVARAGAGREKSLFERKISAEREWREAEAQAIRARAEKEAAENRLHALGVTDAELSTMHVDRHLDSALPLTSPIDGVVVERAATLGQMVGPQDTLFLVMDLRQVWLQVDVYEADLAQVHRGQKATVHVDALPAEEVSGVVDHVGALVDPKSRAVKVRVVLGNPRGDLKPGMFATVTIAGTAGEQRRGIYVPSAAVQRLASEHVVFVARAENTFELRRIELGRADSKFVEVARGLAPGERVVTQGAFALKAELKKDELGGEE